MKQEDVIKSLLSEREYQEVNKLNDESHIVEDFPLAAALEAIRYNVEAANKSWYNEKAPYPLSMEFLRKIGAICLQMGEKYGMEPRSINNF